MTQENQVIDADPSLTVQRKQTVYELAIEDIDREIAIAEKITVKDHTDHAGIEAARKELGIFVKMRTTTNKTRLAGGADLRDQLKKWNNLGNGMIAKMEPHEQRLKTLAETAKREAERLATIEAKEKAAELKRRCDLCNAVGLMLPQDELAAMTPEQFDTIYGGAKKKHDREEAERKAEQERLVKVERDQAERQAELDRKQAAIDRQNELIAQREREARDRLVDERVFALAKAGVDEFDRDAIEAMSVADFAEMIDGETQAFEQRKADEADRIAKETADRLERERIAKESREAEEARVLDEQRKADAAKAPAREKIKRYRELIGLVELPAPLPVKARKALLAARDSFMVEISVIAAKL